jgi:hypothetical protein
MESGSEVLYVHVLQAIYGLMISSLLFYKKLSQDLLRYRFKINLYDPCVANKIVKDNQLTISWHVDDIKVSHADTATVDDFMALVQTTYGQIGKVMETCGKIHSYLGMTLDYEAPGQVTIDMVDYIESMCSFFPQQLEKPTVKSPWTDNLFSISQKIPKLTKEKAELFHTTAAKGLFLCKRGHPNIAPAITFLTTRVWDPTQEDWEKLVQMLRFL